MHKTFLNWPTFFAEPKAKITLLESQAKLIEIMEAYKKGASLTEVERLQNEWKTYYQVSDAEAKVIIVPRLDHSCVYKCN